MRFVAVIVCACALVPATVPSASAQTADAARLDALQRQLAQQQAELQRLRQQVDSQQATIERLPPTVEPISLQTGGTAKDSAVAKAAEPKKGDDGWIDLSSEKWTIKLGGHVQTDYVMWADHSPTIPAAAFGRRRNWVWCI